MRILLDVHEIGRLAPFSWQRVIDTICLLFAFCVQIVCKLCANGLPLIMAAKVVVSVYLDTRRAKGPGLFPVKLRVFSSELRKAKFFPTKYDYSEKDFQSIWGTTKPRSEFKEIRMALQLLEAQVYEIANELRPFSFEALMSKLYDVPVVRDNVLAHYDHVINKLKKEDRIGSASSYECARKSIAKFAGADNLVFQKITPAWLLAYEKHMLQKGCGRTTVGIYLRTLRAIFNTAVAEGKIEKDIYPFGKRKYQIPAGRNIKKALDPADLKKLFSAVPVSNEQTRARDFWFFSYSCNGMNIKDIALLRYPDISEDKFQFQRAKTINTKKDDAKPIQVYLTAFAKEVIEKYGNKDKGSYVFPIITEKLNESQKHRAIQNFTRGINQGIKKLAKSVGVTADISTYYARHSFSTNLIRQGGRLEHVTEALGHSDTKTTMNYFAGFEDASIKERADKLMDF
jgi:integrase/recombinase XerD